MRHHLARFALLSAVLTVTLLASPSAQAATAPDVVRDYCGPQCMPDRCEDALRATGTYASGYACNTMVSSLTYFKGYANIRDQWCTTLMVAAWRWTGRWTRTWLSGGTRIYVHPYAVDWSWVWTWRTGWLAVRDSNIIVNRWIDPWAPQPMCAYNPDARMYVG